MNGDHKQPELCYLACPYSHPDAAVRNQRYEAATRAAARLIMQGEHVYSPLTNTHPVAEMCDLPLDWAFWGPLDRAFIAHSSRLYVLTLPGWTDSKGVLAEIEIAEKLGVPVTYLLPSFIESDKTPSDQIMTAPSRARALLRSIPKTDWSQIVAAKPFTTESPRSTKVFFTADHHFFHNKIIELVQRPFSNLAEMHDCLITRWNEIVRPGDLVYHLGDFALTSGRSRDVDDVNEILSQLHGQVQLICGNHDRQPVRRAKFAWVGDYKRITLEGHSIVLFHYPILNWQGKWKGAWHVHGHSHSNLTEDQPIANELRLNVGVDFWDFRPVCFEIIHNWIGTVEADVPNRPR